MFHDNPNIAQYSGNKPSANKTAFTYNLSVRKQIKNMGNTAHFYKEKANFLKP
jgi:hypothetical protein